MALREVLCNAHQAQERAGHGEAIRILGNYHGKEFRISIYDKGDKPDPDVFRRAFEPFYTTNLVANSAGLGLTAARAALARSGGRISLEALPIAGVEARLALPLLLVDEHEDSV